MKEIGIRVLLADDHAVVREGLRLVLEAAGDIVVAGEASTGLEVVRTSVDLGPDVVLMDVAMPELDGIEAARRVCAACRHTKVVMLSMHGAREHVTRSLRAGARGYVLKEAAAREVVEAVRTVHAGRRYLSARAADVVVDAYADEGDSDSRSDPLAALSDREREVLLLVAQGNSSSQVGEALFLSPKTIDTYRSRAMRKLGIHDVAGVVRFVIEHELLPASTPDED